MKNTNDGTTKDPYLRIDINIGNLDNLPRYHSGPQGTEAEKLAAVKAAGYLAVQDGDVEICKKLGLHVTASGKIVKRDQIHALAEKSKQENMDCLTVHVGTGLESDNEMDILVESVISASQEYDLPIFIETHRATITQDMWRTVELIKRYPEIRFNGDFSHWYTGQEMVYGDFEKKLDFLSPVFERVRFIHGRIGNPGSIQVDISDGKHQSCVEHFKEMWIRSFRGFLSSAFPGDYISFTPELLPPHVFYARLLKLKNGEFQEECDRWQQALVYREIAQECFQKAKTTLYLP